MPPSHEQPFSPPITNSITIIDHRHSLISPRQCPKTRKLTSFSRKLTQSTMIQQSTCPLPTTSTNLSPNPPVPPSCALYSFSSIFSYHFHRKFGSSSIR